MAVDRFIVSLIEVSMAQKIYCGYGGLPWHRKRLNVSVDRFTVA